jgi:hypothetical protein
MPEVVGWTEPAQATEWELRRRTAEFKRALKIFLKWTVPLAVVGLYLIYRFAYRYFDRAVDLVVVWVLIGGFMHLVASKLRFSRGRARYALEPRGLRGGQPAVRFRWGVMKAYRIVDHPELYGVRCFEFMAGRFPAWIRWSFDPTELDEARLRAVLYDYLPGKYSDYAPAT